MPIVLLALFMFVQTLTAGTGLRALGREEWAASGAAQEVLEKMRNEDFRDVFRLFNADPFDDPGGPGTAPGNRFAVPGLDPLESNTEGTVGEIVLPVWNTGSEVVPVWEVREDQPDAALGTPRDLNGDCVVDDGDHAADYTLLPVVVHLRWRGPLGPRQLRIHTLFSELR